MFTYFKKKVRGFTLIELLVVIAIIGVLASVVLASLNTARRKGRDARRVSDIKSLQTALELYFDANGEYPDALASLATSYIQVVPTDPNGGAYDYDNLAAGGAGCSVGTGVCITYHMGANLEDNGSPALDGDADGCTTAGTGCVVVLSGTTLSGIDGGGATGNDCVGSGTSVYCFDVTPGA
ncbi:MAG: prepilin-type N-terminal cleavage/methylation domain-containing protein [Candidatus Sungbacteria bacterium]|nr:prepilin-type N-terminal cleavage/methylation domain-containing protein [Candidatus Sungbacteria bacterium]